MATSITFIVEQPEERQAIGLNPEAISRLRTIVALLLVVLILPGLSAGVIPWVPTSQDMPNPVVPNPGMSHLEAVALSYYTCMDAAGLPVEREQDPNGYWTVVTFIGSGISGSVMWRDLAGHAGGIDMGWSDDESREEAFRQFMYIPDPRPMLTIGGIDHTAEYVKCLTISGYDDTAAYAAWGSIDLVNDPRYNLGKQAAADWTSCAQRHGWEGSLGGPDSADVILPSTMTEDQLRRLVAACPNFSADNARKQMEWIEIHPRDPFPEDVPPDPSFTVQISGLDAAYPPGWMPPVEKHLVADHISALYDVLNEPIQAFYAQYNSSIVIFPGW